MVHERDSHSDESRSTSCFATVPLPTPPGPIKTKVKASAGKGLEELAALTCAQPADSTRRRNLRLAHDSCGLHFPDGGDGGNEVRRAHLGHAILRVGDDEDFRQGQITRLQGALDVGAAASISDGQLGRSLTLLG